MGADEDEVLNKYVRYPWAGLHHSSQGRATRAWLSVGRHVVHPALKEQFK